MIGAMTRPEIQVLRAAGMAEAAGARPTGASVRSVRRIAHEPPVTTGDTAALIATRQVGRPSTTAAWAGHDPRRAEDRALPGVDIVRRRQEEHGDRGGKSAV